MLGWPVYWLSPSRIHSSRFSGGGSPLFRRYFSDGVVARVRESAGYDMPPILAKGNHIRLEAPGAGKGAFAVLFLSRYSFIRRFPNTLNVKIWVTTFYHLDAAFSIILIPHTLQGLSTFFTLVLLQVSFKSLPREKDDLISCNFFTYWFFIFITWIAHLIIYNFIFSFSFLLET